jgi:CubicO group peptidase (beta-lactamase class C family)
VTRRILLLAALALSAWAADTPAPAPRPDSAGMSSERLARIDTWLNGIIERREAAGFVSLVARHGKIVQHRAYGTRGLENHAPMPREALFDLASMTKPITVVAALTLLEEGRFTLDDPISKFIPEFKDPKLELPGGELRPARKEITVRDLFTHTSGVYNNRSRRENTSFPTLADYIRALAAQPLRYEPGTHWLYGSSHDILGYLVERVSGQGLDRFVEDRILRPLAMNDTHYWPPAETDSRRAILVVDGRDDPKSASRVSPEAVRAHSFIGGASGLYSTAADYARFSQMLLNGGVLNGRRILGPRTVGWMTLNQIGDLDSFSTPGTRFGLGLAVVTDPGAAGLPYSAGTYYWSGSQGTIFWVDPVEDLVAVLMVQAVPNPLKLREKFTALVYSSIID